MFLRLQHLALESDRDILERQGFTTAANGLLGDSGHTGTAGNLHVQHGQTLEGIDLHDRLEFLHVGRCIVEFGTADGNGLAPQETIVEITHGEGNAVRHPQQVRIGEIGSLRRNQLDKVFSLRVCGLIFSSISEFNNLPETDTGVIDGYQLRHMNLKTLLPQQCDRMFG